MVERSAPDQSAGRESGRNLASDRCPLGPLRRVSRSLASRRMTRRLADPRAPQVASRLHAGSVLIQPVGAVEQHGPHPPLSTDLLIASDIAELVVAEHGDELDLWLLPPLAYSKSNEHHWAPGTIWLGAQTLLACSTASAARWRRCRASGSCSSTPRRQQTAADGRAARPAGRARAHDVPGAPVPAARQRRRRARRRRARHGGSRRPRRDVDHAVRGPPARRARRPRPRPDELRDGRPRPVPHGRRHVPGRRHLGAPGRNAAEVVIEALTS